MPFNPRDSRGPLMMSDSPAAPYEGFSEVANSPTVGGFFDHSPVLGAANPLAPPLRLEFASDRIVASATFGAAYEGPPGCVHGGWIAASFDEVLGAAQSLSGSGGMTAYLKVDYRSPTPLHQELRSLADPPGRLPAPGHGGAVSGGRR